MLIDKKCDFITDHGIEYTGIIVEKYNGADYEYNNLSMDYYIVNIGDKLKHLPCSSLVKIHNESVIDSKETIVTKSEDKGLVYGGQIAHLPIEIVERMLIEQELQGNPRNVSVFEKNMCANKGCYGFSWTLTDDGSMWCDTLNNNNFTKFYEKYPKIN